MIETTIEIKGLKEIDDAMRELPVELQRRVLRTGLKYAMDVFIDGMRRRAPRALEHRVMRKGRQYPARLADSIVGRIRITKTGDATARVGYGHAFWGMFRERGTKYQSPRPFMIPTLEEDGQIAISAFANGARDQLERIVRKVRRTTLSRGIVWHSAAK